MGKIVHSPHDKLVKATLHDIEKAKEFLNAHLSNKAKKYIDLNKGLELVNNEFIKKNQRELRCDVIYRANITNQQGYIYAHIETQSTPEELLPIRILAYDLEIITYHWKNIKKEIPPIINLILYNGTQSPYPYKINILDLLEEHKITKELLLEGNTLIDLSLHEDREIEKHNKTALMELLLKHSKHNHDFYNFLQKLKKSGKFKVLLAPYEKGYIEFILLFIADILNSKNHSIKEITDLFMNISPEINTDIMTVRQAMEYKYTQEGRQEGRQEGIQEGIQEGRQEEKLIVAKNLLNMKSDPSFIQKATGLTKTEINKLILKK